MGSCQGRVDSLNKFSVEELASLKAAGLDRIHSGYESGSDKVLALLNKGYTKAQEIEAGRKVKASGIELSIYYMIAVQTPANPVYAGDHPFQLPHFSNVGTLDHSSFVDIIDQF